MATVAAKHPSFRRPDVFTGDIPKTKWESATVTTIGPEIPTYIEKIAKRPVRRQGRHRWHRHCEGLGLVHELNRQPATAVQGPAT